MRTRFSVINDDICSVHADVLLLKHAEGFHGADWAVADRLVKQGVCTEDLLRVQRDLSVLVKTRGAVAASSALFLGTKSLYSFGYAEMESFARTAVAALTTLKRPVERLATTIHGAGYGLDAEESLQRLYRGFLEALEKHPHLQVDEVVFVEVDARRATLLARTLDSLLGSGRPSGLGTDAKLKRERPARVVFDLPTAKQPVPERSKPHVFVAMPFSDEFEDVYVYGIYEPVRACSLICEKTNESAYTGDILHRIRDRIETSSLVIADMTGARPNVYLEVGYAWGKGIPVLFIARAGEQLHFDVSRHRCVYYKSIRELAKELGALVPKLIARDPQ